jgi:uncharacterized protein YegP (UPF0339 family)
MPATPKVMLWQARNGRWYFHKKNRNGQVTQSSQGYKEKRYAKVAIKRDIPGLPIEEVR